MENEETTPNGSKLPTDDNARDADDLARAQDATEEAGAGEPLWKKLGPGLITGVADDDPSGIGTYSVAGAQFGYGLVWMAPFTIPLVIVVQEMAGRIGSITGEGLAAVLKKHYPPGILWTAVALLFLANIINVWADLNVMAASAQMLFGVSFTFWLTVISGGTIALLILVPYRLYVRYLKWLCLALLAYVVTALLPSVHHDWGAIARNLVLPQWQSDFSYLMAVVGYLGTTISPYCFFWQAGETVEEEISHGVEAEPGHRRFPVNETEIRTVRDDTVVGMLISQVIAFFIIICTAATLHAQGKTDIETAQDAARALLPLGPSAYWLFTLGILGAGLLGIPTLAGSAAYALAETFGWRYGLYRQFGRARAFYGTIAGVVALGYVLNFVQFISPVKALLYAAVLNGAVAPPLIVLMLLICNNPAIVGERRNGLWSNIVGGFAAAIMSLAVCLLLWGLAMGKAG